MGPIGRSKRAVASDSRKEIAPAQMPKRFDKSRRVTRSDGENHPFSDVPCRQLSQPQFGYLFRTLSAAVQSTRQSRRPYVSLESPLILTCVYSILTRTADC